MLWGNSIFIKSRHIFAAAGSVLIWFGLVAHATADVLCDDLSGYSTGSVELENLSPDHLENFTGCTLQSGATPSVICSWEFSFRDEAANVLLTTLRSEIEACLKSPDNVRVDDSVNHPDSFDNKIYDLGGTLFRISKKDKGEIQKTYIFVIFHPNT